MVCYFSMVVWRNGGEASACWAQYKGSTVLHNEYVTQNAAGKKEANERRAEGAVRQPETHWVQHTVPAF